MTNASSSFPIGFGLLIAAIEDLLGGFRPAGAIRPVASAGKAYTTLFAELRDFEPFGARAPRAEAAETVNTIVDCLHHAVGTQRGIVKVYIRNGVLALFGAQIENHAAAAATAALRARASVDRLAESRRTHGLTPLRIGIALNTEEVAEDRVARQTPGDAAVIASAEQIVSRLAAAADPGEILLGATTAGLLRSRFEIREKGVREVKGIGPTRVFELVGRPLRARTDLGQSDRE